MKIKNIIIGFAVVGLLVSFGGGFYAGSVYSYVPPIKGVQNVEAGQPEGVDFSLFWDVWRVIQEDYAGAGNDALDFQSMVHGAIEGMVDSLGDPYTNFMTAKKTETFLEDIEGSFSGVGMEVGMQEDQLQVIAPLEGTPAEAAGLRPGDHIVKIDETFTAELSIDESVALIRGTEGSIVTLTIFREGWTESKEFPITRAVITIPSLRWEEKEEGIAYVKIFQFTENLRSDFRQLENNIIGAGADKIIIDVRNNPGGYLHSAVDVSGWFLERGDTVVIEDYGTEQEQEVHKARGNGRFKNYSIVVLINGGSASASEILAGALRDNRGIVLVGEKSFGKGSVQELRDLKNNASLKVTIANWLTPQGVLITGEGLHPDIEVDFSDEDFEQGRDPQLDKAIEVLKNL